MRIFLTGMLLLASQFLIASFSIEGKIILDSGWDNRIYLSEIPSFDEMYTTSEDMIVFAGIIDSSGYFKLEGDFLPTEEKLYRLHICKKGDPVSSIIIGGRDENFLFIIANNDANIRLEDQDEESLFSDVQFLSGTHTRLLQEVQKIINIPEKNTVNEFPIGRRFLQLAVEEKLKAFADTTSHLLISLFALYHTDYGNDVETRSAFYEKLFKQARVHYASYLIPFESEWKMNEDKGTGFLKDIVLFSLGIICGIGIFFVWGKFKTKPSKPSENLKIHLYQELSIQERKITSMIRTGKSNQEIADELNIEVSTVKSHVRSIYKKLDIRSRKEVMDLEIKEGVLMA